MWKEIIFKWSTLIPRLCLPCPSNCDETSPSLSFSLSLQMKECGTPLSDSSLPAVGLFQCRWSAWGQGSATSSESSLLIAMVMDSLAHPRLLSLVNTHTHTQWWRSGQWTNPGWSNLCDWSMTEFLVSWKHCWKLLWTFCAFCLLPSRGKVT